MLGVSAITEPLVIWRLTDGKPGHDNQSLGLVEALGRLVAVDARNFRCNMVPPAGSQLKPPALVVGAGRAIQKPLLALKKQWGTRAVVLMRPYVSPRAFDLCLIPEHDRPASAPNVMTTLGALNRVQPGPKRAGQGLIVLGGPSAHHDWLDREVVTQCERICARQNRAQWTICDSRRTPSRTRDLLRAALPDVRYADYREVAAGWLADQMASAQTIWVGEDSVSMVYEALSSGAGVGLLTIPRRKPSRVVRGVVDLVRRGQVTTYPQWLSGAKLETSLEPLAEADRCAHWIATHWLNAT